MMKIVDPLMTEDSSRVHHNRAGVVVEIIPGSIGNENLILEI